MSSRHTGNMTVTNGAGGETDIASAAALFADPTRARVLMALSDGRELVRFQGLCAKRRALNYLASATGSGN